MKKEIGLFIKAFIKQSELDQKKICNKINLTPRQMSKYVKGEQSPKMEKFFEMVAAANCSVSINIEGYNSIKNKPIDIVFSYNPKEEEE